MSNSSFTSSNYLRLIIGNYVYIKRILLICFALIAISGCNETDEAAISADIVLYSDKGCWDKSVTAAKNMFQWMDMIEVPIGI
jgi:hypothetical protein